MTTPLVAIRDLTVRFVLPRGETIKAVERVSLDIFPRETLGLVGESGSGKTTLGRAILRLVNITSGEVRYRGELLGNRMRPFRQHMQMIFQDQYASLDPLMSVGAIIGEPIHALRLPVAGNPKARVENLLTMVGLQPGDARRRPHEFSGGQRQRIAIARALAAQPDFIVADEPISALDVSMQAEILNLLSRFQLELGLAYLFISHDLRAVRHVADRIAVMYLGEIVELAPTVDLFASPRMPYTRALVSALREPHPEIEARRKRLVLSGEIPSLVNLPSGCHFRTRCPYAIPECSQRKPPWTEISAGHSTACIRIGPLEPDIERAAEKGIRVQQ